MHEPAREVEALERLQVLRGRLADRMQPPWWYLPGVMTLWALVFTFPFGPRLLPHGFTSWPFLAAALAVALLLQWGLARATGIAVGAGNLGYSPGRPARIAMIVVSFVSLWSETLLIDRNLVGAAIAVAALAVLAEVVCQQASLRQIRQSLRGGGGAA